jgi:hypothetical protein
MRRPNRAWILGCGPAGLFAAASAEAAGLSVRIYSKARPSRMFGAQYLHAPIPGLTEERDCFDLEYVLRGTVDGYRAKVYGPGSNAETSPERLLGFHRAWNIRTAYERAWERYENLVEHAELRPEAVEALAQTARSAKRTLVISSLPAPVLCLRRDLHRFEVAEIWAMGDAPEMGQYAPVTVTPETVVCNGEDSPRWYRAANILGHRSVEWPSGQKPPVNGVAKVQKPLWTNCDCQPGVIRVGRYGTWTKGILSHQAYEEVQRVRAEG